MKSRRVTLVTVSRPPAPPSARPGSGARAHAPTPDAAPRPAPAAAPTETLDDVLAHLRANQPARAAAACEQRIARDATDAGAWHLLGLARAAQQDDAGAVHSLREANRLRPDDADIRRNLLTALAQFRQHALDRATAHFSARRYDEAEAQCQSLLALDPQEFDALRLQGAIALARGQAQRAFDLLDPLFARQPNHAEVNFHRACALQQLGRLDAALAGFDRVVALQPDHAEAHLRRGRVLAALKLREAAVVAFDRAIGCRPDSASAYANRALALMQLGMPEAALASGDRAVALDARSARYRNLRGAIRNRLRQHEAEIADYQQAIALQPGFAEPWMRLGSALQMTNRYAEALQAYERALAVDGSLIDAHCGCAQALGALQRHEEALAAYEHAVALDPRNVRPRFERSMLLLALGQFERGWLEYEWRWKVQGLSLKPRDFPQPQWAGGNIAGKTILLHPEQGYGDAIQFARYASQVAAQGARVVMEMHPPLLPLMQGLEGVHQWVRKGDALPPFDVHCPFMSLPLALDTRLDTIPADVPYLRADPARVQRWRDRLGAPRGLRIGLAWSGNEKHVSDRHRSLPLATLMAHLPEGVEGISLQKDLRTEDRRTLAAQDRVRHFGDEIQDFGDTAALCELVDLVLTVDTSIAHVAGALGRPAWVLLSLKSDWRWLLAREDSPWYPSLRLWRQRRLDDWDEVLERVATELAPRVAAPSTARDTR